MSNLLFLDLLLKMKQVIYYFTALEENVYWFKFVISIVKNNTYSRIFTIKNWQFFSVVKTIPKFLQTYVVYQFTCAGCNACYIGKTQHYLKTRIEEHLGKHKNQQILKYLQKNSHCRQVTNFDCFVVIDCDNSHFSFQLKEASR